jgi:hypothetical protein
MCVCCCREVCSACVCVVAVRCAVHVCVLLLRGVHCMCVCVVAVRCACMCVCCGEYALQIVVAREAVANMFVPIICEH